jgi:hypothetical protein
VSVSCRDVIHVVVGNWIGTLGSTKVQLGDCFSHVGVLLQVQFTRLLKQDYFYAQYESRNEKKKVKARNYN